MSHNKPEPQRSRRDFLDFAGAHRSRQRHPNPLASPHHPYRQRQLRTGKVRKRKSWSCGNDAAGTGCNMWCHNWKNSIQIKTIDSALTLTDSNGWSTGRNRQSGWSWLVTSLLISQFFPAFNFDQEHVMRYLPRNQATQEYLVSTAHQMSLRAEHLFLSHMTAHVKRLMQWTPGIAGGSQMDVPLAQLAQLSCVLHFPRKQSALCEARKSLAGAHSTTCVHLTRAVEGIWRNHMETWEKPWENQKLRANLLDGEQETVWNCQVYCKDAQRKNEPYLLRPCFGSEDTKQTGWRQLHRSEKPRKTEQKRKTENRFFASILARCGFCHVLSCSVWVLSPEPRFGIKFASHVGLLLKQMYTASNQHACEELTCDVAIICKRS